MTGYVVAALFIAVGIVVVIVVLAVGDSREPKPDPAIMFWSELQPGNRYHVEIISPDGLDLVFTDEFVGYSNGNSKAHFAGRTVLWSGRDQIRVQLAS